MSGKSFTRELARARHRVRVQLLRDVRLERVQPKRRRGNTCEGEHVVRGNDIGLAEDRIAERETAGATVEAELNQR